MGLPARLLNTFISREDLLKESTCSVFLMCEFLELFLPTETVVTKPQIVTPLTTRVYRTMQYLVEPPRHPMRSLLCYEELIKKGDFQGTGNEVEVYLWEVWTDGGEDGHIGYEHRGYVLSTLEPEGECYPVDIFLPWDWKKEDLVF